MALQKHNCYYNAEIGKWLMVDSLGQPSLETIIGQAQESARCEGGIGYGLQVIQPETPEVAAAVSEPLSSNFRVVMSNSSRNECYYVGEPSGPIAFEGQVLGQLSLSCRGRVAYLGSINNNGLPLNRVFSPKLTQSSAVGEPASWENLRWNNWIAFS